MGVSPSEARNGQEYTGPGLRIVPQQNANKADMKDLYHLTVSSAFASLCCHGYSFSASLINNSCFSDRGLIEMRYGTGCDTTPGSNLISGSTTLPCSISFSNLKTASDCAIVRNNALSATYRPGHTRRPYPKVQLRGSGSGSAPRKRSGLKSMGDWYTAGSWVNHLGLVSSAHICDEKG
jgi:hypothetical protein